MAMEAIENGVASKQIEKSADVITQMTEDACGAV
jgi:hypothetical protein